AVGSLGHTPTLVLILGSTWSPAISTLSSGHHSEACSGAWPRPTMTSQRWPPSVMGCAWIRRWNDGGSGATPPAWPPLWGPHGQGAVARRAPRLGRAAREPPLPLSAPRAAAGAADSPQPVALPR